MYNEKALKCKPSGLTRIRAQRAHEAQSCHVQLMHILCVTESMRKTKQQSSKSGTPRARFFALFKVVSSLLIAFLASLEGSVIEMRPAAQAP